MGAGTCLERGDPELHLRTDKMTVEDEVTAIVDYLVNEGIIKVEHFTRTGDTGTFSAAAG